jgi:hypothetical protein
MLGNLADRNRHGRVIGKCVKTRRREGANRYAFIAVSPQEKGGFERLNQLLELYFVNCGADFT